MKGIDGGLGEINRSPLRLELDWGTWSIRPRN